MHWLLPGGDMGEEEMETLKKLNREYLNTIWQAAKTGDLELLSGEAKRFGTSFLEV